jgi:hypothetical protein
MLGYLRALQAQADLQQQSPLRNPLYVQVMVAATAVIAILQKLADIQMLKLFVLKDCQSK